MSRTSSPLPLSDDSAVESMSSNNPINSNENRSKATRPSTKDFLIDNSDLELAAKQEINNVNLISRSARTVFSCFDDLDLQGFEPRLDYLINFISNGNKCCSSSILRPMSILWPDRYGKMVEELSILDAFLLNTNFREKPVDWMLKRGLIIVPTCKNCKDKMSISYDNNTIRWHCQKTPGCSNYVMPIQRSSFFSNYEYIGLDKLLFSIYFWSTCTPAEQLYASVNIEPQALKSIWRRIQNVCRIALEKSYPRHRLTNVLDQGLDKTNGVSEPIDLVSIKLNDLFIVCAKHPSSNLVRLGLYIPNVSRYSFVDLTEQWFAHGAHVRVAETKFLDLSQRRKDLKVELVSRLQIISNDKTHFHDSAFGYLIYQLAQTLKDFDSSSLSCEDLKLILAELQWRELFGTRPFDAFTNIVSHMANYCEAIDWYSEPALEKSYQQNDESAHESDYVWVEKYFYASVDPIDSDGKVICRFMELPSASKPPQPDVRVLCHDCSQMFDCYDFSVHMIDHVEENRGELGKKNYLLNGSIECKHCFKTFDQKSLLDHSRLFRSHYHTIRYGCRICCVKLKDREEYLQHMRRSHFEFETPYRCPKCLFASSFQRDIFIHFQEEHRHQMAVLCPLCLRSFSVSETMTDDKMRQLSMKVYAHIAEHYSISKAYTCSQCCLCFLDKKKLFSHKRLHHNPLEIRDTGCVKVEPFVVAPEERGFCIKALRKELFISNKQPNLIQQTLQQSVELYRNPSPHGESSSRKNVGSLLEIESDVSDDSFVTASDTIHVRGLPSEAEKLLDGGCAVMKVCTNKKTVSTTTVEHACSSQNLIDYLSRMSRVDGIIPNQSVILTPQGKPAKCIECFKYISTDHFVARLKCKDCKYATYCPRAATTHNQVKHDRSA